MEYSFNAIKEREGLAFAQRYEINASYKDLGAVCDAVRYMKAKDALDVLDKVIQMQMPILYKRHNKHMGARHELGGRKGGYPRKAANEVRLTLLNAIANAKNKAMGGDDMFIIHATANKTHIERRQPSKGSLAWGRGMYGRSAINHSDIEYAKVEIALAEDTNSKLTKNMKYFIRKKNKNQNKETIESKPAKKTPAPKPKEEKKPVEAKN